MNNRNKITDEEINKLTKQWEDKLFELMLASRQQLLLYKYLHKNPQKENEKIQSLKDN